MLRCGDFGKLALVVLAAGLASCASVPVPPPLTGTTWQLHAIQSMDDTQGTMQIADPSRFTLNLGADGRASLRLDCNRGTGTWKSMPSGDNTGTIEFGPIASTRALCPPPRLDERVARDLAYVHGYLLKDGKLFLTLKADGAIYEWHRLKD